MQHGTSGQRREVSWGNAAMHPPSAHALAARLHAGRRRHVEHCKKFNGTASACAASVWERAPTSRLAAAFEDALTSAAQHVSQGAVPVNATAEVFLLHTYVVAHTMVSVALSTPSFHSLQASSVGAMGERCCCARGCPSTQRCREFSRSSGGIGGNTCGMYCIVQR